MLEYIGEPYDEKRFLHTEKEQWFAEKYGLGFDFPNVCSALLNSNRVNPF